ncbi:expressed unknown protein [Seminavis robusta]|uniref:Zinc finger RING-type eukaryotic domain-containing protein n=1 Tax=Seminavis robusta TaxID=568900 RepID=A0A9N8E5L9_9STRA|nr:expressed unknown protein [Seminavis robusta]|eukprot:Sro566_g167720.1 n/a (720) ;mRNA; f:847-3006
MPRHQSDADFLALEEIVYGFTRRMHRGDFFHDSSSSDDDDLSNDGDDCLSCPVCKRHHPYIPPPTNTASTNSTTEDVYSHDARVVYASFACPICLEDAAGPPMVVLSCGHAICQNDFRLLGGSTKNRDEDLRVRQAAAPPPRTHNHANNTNESDNEMEVAMRMIAASFGMLHSSQTALEEFANSHIVEGMENNNSNNFPFGRANATSTTRGPFTSNRSDEARDNDDDDADSSFFQDSDDDDDDELFSERQGSVDFDLEDVDAILWRLSQYHPGFMVDTTPDDDNIQSLPKTGQWLLVPEMADDEKVNLIYYCEGAVPHGLNNLEVSKQFPRGTRMVPNGMHGVYVHTPPPSNNHRNLWNVYYVKNFKYNERSIFSSYHQRSEPSFRYRIPRNAQFVPDGKGGIWALIPEPSLPDNVRNRPAEPADHSSSDPTATRRQSDRRRRYQRDKRDYRLVHYSRAALNGQVMGNSTAMPAYCRIFMDAQSGGVYLLQPNVTNTNEDDDDEEQLQSTFSSLWHVSVEDPSNPVLMYGGIPRGAKVMGDAMGHSVFLLSPGGRLQSILTRVQVEQQQQQPSTTTTDARTTTTCFSYDLDIPVDGIKDIVEGNAMDQVFVHCRQPHPNNTGANVWKLCRLDPPEETATRDAQVVALDTDCPRNSRILSDGEGGVWIWRKPVADSLSQNGDRSFVHAANWSNPNNTSGRLNWCSPCVFPPGTRLAHCSY